eukprot:TRINITY_DN5010_c0_g1_i1.p1 TRINITY_DN5010_c0_g1~~TRINITY_DN5010_c0_g1_i1.p1  ORF type:complete len:171 (-),score=48.79 TRINITY_DN5010_c0_g1_i1:12-524(-)
MSGVEALNRLSEAALLEELIKCCNSRSWAHRVVATTPYSSLDDLLAKSDASWSAATADDCLEAFEGHPMIGESQLREKFGSTAGWASNEQKGVSGASEEVLGRLLDLNQRYKDKFGYIFIICASGKSAEEMAQACEERLGNDPEAELRNCLLYTSPSPRDRTRSRMPSSA